MLRRRALLAAAATLAAGLAQGAVATAAHATTTVTTIDVPTAERWEPRQATHLSVGDTAFSYSLETTPGLDVDGSATHSRLHSFSGDDKALDKDATLDRKSVV